MTCSNQRRFNKVVQIPLIDWRNSKVVITTDSIHINEYPCHELNKNCVLELPIKPDKKDKTLFTIRDWE